MATLRRLLLLTLLVPACTIIVDRPPVVVDPPPPKRAYMLWLVNLDRSAVNMAADYEQLIREFEVALAAQTPAVVVDRLGVMALNRRTTLGARLLHGENVPTQPIEIDLSTGLSPDLLVGLPLGKITEVIAAAAGSSYLDRFDPSRGEQQNLAEIAPTLASEFVYDPFAETPGRALYDGSPDLFIVGTITHLARACALGEGQCALDGQSPDAFFTAETQGRADWLNIGEKGLPASKIFHVAFSTAEGESTNAFYSRCGSITGFPQNYLDFLEPSPDAYYEPLAAHASGRFFREDLCSMLGVTRGARLVLLARALAQAAAK